MNIKKQILYYYEHPPRNLSEFVIQPAQLLEFGFDGHGFSGKYPDGLRKKLNVMFKVSCQCGGQTHIIVAKSIGYDIYFHDGFITADRFYLKCVSCESLLLLFDPMLHGYNAETTFLEDTSGENENIAQFDKSAGIHSGMYCCQNCGNDALEVFTRYEYSSDLFQEAEFIGRTQDFFSWFTLAARCANCAYINRPVEYECA